MGGGCFGGAFAAQRVARRALERLEDRRS